MPNLTSEANLKKYSPRICIVGAGVSGICMGIQLEKQLGIKNYTIFDENTDVGGTWLVNTYPGCACDIPSHLYSFSFEPNPKWSESFSSQPEILSYLQSIARKYKLYEKIKFNHQVTKLEWDETISKWKVLVRNKKKDSENELIFDIVLSALGGLRVPNVPQEFESFKGRKVHSAKWDSKIKLANKRVGIIGTGASAVQIIPKIVEDVKKLVVYQRNPPWVVPRMQFQFPQWLQWTFGTIPGVQKAFRASLFWLYELSYNLYNKDSKLGNWAEGLGKNYLKKQVKASEDIQNSLTPNYKIGCKRITPSDEYYTSLMHQNTTLVTSKIMEIKTNSIVTEDGNEEKLDVLILATGYRVQDFFAPLEIVGKNSTDIMATWKTAGPSTYLGMCASILPNFFFAAGPNSLAGNTSYIFSVECQVNWLMQVLGEMIKRRSTVVQVDEKVEAEWMQVILKDLKETVWGAYDCGNYYQDHRGVVTALNPYSALNVWKQTRTADFSKFHFI